MKACGQKLVTFCTLTHTHTTAAKLVVRMVEHNEDRDMAKLTMVGCNLKTIMTQVQTVQ